MRHPLSRLTAALVLLLAIAGCAPTEMDACTGRMDPGVLAKCEPRERWTPEWKEARTVLPAAPQQADLSPIEAPRGAPGYRYFVDRKSISRGSDGVMRYTVVARSPSGVSNAFHEGLHCVNDTVRTYGFAGSDGVLRAAQAQEWRPLAIEGPRGYQDYLGNVVMCDRQGYDWPVEKVLRALDAQYTAGGVRVERQCMDMQNCGVHNRRD